MRNRFYSAPSHSYIPVKVSPIPVDGEDRMRQRKLSSSLSSSPWSASPSIHSTPSTPSTSLAPLLFNSPLGITIPSQEQNDELPTPPSTPCKGPKSGDPLLFMPLRRASIATHPSEKDVLPKVPESPPSVSQDHANKLVAELEEGLAEIVGIQNRLAASPSANVTSIQSALDTLDHVQTILTSLNEFSSRVNDK